VTPDDLFRATNKGGSSPTKGNVEQDKMMQRMGKDLSGLREEIQNLRAKLRALEEGQMTVDNVKLSRQLENEKDDLNKERAKLLKIYAQKNDKLDEDRKKLLSEIQSKEQEVERQRVENEEAQKKLEVEKLELKDKLADGERKVRDIDNQERKLKDQLAAHQRELDKLNKEKEQLREYALELEDLKENLMREREALAKDRARMFNEKDVLDQEIKEMKAQKADLEKNRDKELKEVNRRKLDVDFREERLKKEQDDFNRRKADFEDTIKNLDKMKKETSKLKEELEEHNLNLWKDRNKLNQEVKSFIEDKKAMENDLKWQKKELKEAIEEMDKERDELDQERDELNKYSDELEGLKLDLEARERKLLMEQEDFYNMKKRFLEKLLESGNLEAMTPEMKQMAANMGIDVDEMIQENKRLKDRRDMMDKLKKENDDTLAKIKEMGSRNASRSQSRRASYMRLADKNTTSDIGKELGRKVAVQDYLDNLYEMSSTKHMLRDIEEKREQVKKLSGELDVAQKIIEALRKENKEIKREFDIISKITEEMRGNSKIDLDAILGRKRQTAETQTEGDILMGGETEYLHEKIKQLEKELRKKSLEEKLNSNPNAPRRSDFEDEDDQKHRATELDDMMKE
jgi:chromosome segregation ATPase